MNELEQYIREHYGQERQELEEIRQLAAEALPTVVDSWSSEDKAWPYEAFERPPPAENYSFSTNSMILFMLSVVLERTKTSSLMPSLSYTSGFVSMLCSRLERDLGKGYQQTMETRFWQGLARLLEKVTIGNSSESKNGTRKSGNTEATTSKLLTHSTTYGENDVLTLTWLTELLRVAQESGPKDSDNNNAAKIKEHLNLREPLGEAVKELQKATLEGQNKRDSETSSGENADGDGFPPNQRSRLRCLFYREHMRKLAAGHKPRKGQERETEPTDKLPKPLEHPFPLIRLVQLLEAHHRLKAEPTGDRVEDRLSEEQLGGKALREYFEHGLHEHIAYHSIPDSRFDPAFLVFCLEGALRFPAPTVSMETIERALTILEQSQKETPYWRSLTPILSTPQGNVLFPVSVEVANSLLRITWLLDRRYEEPRNFLRCRSLLQRYVRWLRAQRISKSHNGRVYYGWHSEHVADPNQIHLWLTSEVIVFLVNYQLRFQEGMAYTMLKASGLEVKREQVRDRPPGIAPSEFWRNGPPNDRERDGWLQTEPLAGHPNSKSPYLIYDVILKKYLEPRDPGRQEKQSPAYSILLYGPPGTGKTTVCEEIARSLGWAFVTVTPSDFLAGGAAEVEARAKAIFTTLQEQRDKVVLLDEIDHFLLDRESSEYARQTGIFQFMTPGMLTKINNLRRAESLIFIIATNYEERIDTAIKRPGRVDHQLLLLPPNLAQRNRTLRRLFEKEESKRKRSGDTRSKEGDRNQELADIARKMSLFTYTELEELVNKVVVRDYANGQALQEALDNARQSIKPAITLRGYTRRFYEAQAEAASGDGRQPKLTDKRPIVEYLMLLYIWLEAIFGSGEGKTLTEMGIPPDEQDVREVRDLLTALHLWPSGPESKMNQRLAEHVRDNHVVARLAEWLPKLEGSACKGNQAT